MKRILGSKIGLGLGEFPGRELLIANRLVGDWGIWPLAPSSKRPVADWELGGFWKGPELTLFEKIVGGGLKLELVTFSDRRLLFAKGRAGGWELEITVLPSGRLVTGWELGSFLKGPELTLFEKIVGGGLELGLKTFLGWGLKLPVLSPKRPVVGLELVGFLKGPEFTLFEKMFGKIGDVELPKSCSLFIEPARHLGVGILIGRRSGSGEGVGYMAEFIVDGLLVWSECPESLGLNTCCAIIGSLYSAPQFSPRLSFPVLVIPEKRFYFRRTSSAPPESVRASQERFATYPAAKVNLRSQVTHEGFVERIAASFQIV